MKLTHETQYLIFREAAYTGKTVVEYVYSKSQNLILGKISWHGPWRQYCFIPEGNTIWNRGCLTDINDRITALMNERKKTRE